MGGAREGRHHRQRAAGVVWGQRAFPRVLGRSAALPERLRALIPGSGFAHTAASALCPELLSMLLFHHVSLSLPTSRFGAEDGVSIPCSYTSYLAPLSSSKLYNEVRGCRERDKDPECHFETPYVVRLHNFHQLAEPKACFTFKHPTTGWLEKHLGSECVVFFFVVVLFLVFKFLPDPISDMNNNRYQSLRFSMSCNSVLHGFAGYFETTLYKDVTLSMSLSHKAKYQCAAL